MATVRKYRDEDFESLFRRWKRKVNQENIIGDMKKHEEYQKPSDEKREHLNEVKRKVMKAKMKRR